MKTIEEVAFGRYLSDQSLPERKRMHASNYIDWAQLGAREAQRWIPFNEEMPLILVEIILMDEKDRKAKRVYKPMTNGDIHWCCETYTHWRPIERK